MAKRGQRWKFPDNTIAREWSSSLKRWAPTTKHIVDYSCDTNKAIETTIKLLKPINIFDTSQEKDAFMISKTKLQSESNTMKVS